MHEQVHEVYRSYVYPLWFYFQIKVNGVIGNCVLCVCTVILPSHRHGALAYKSVRKRYINKWPEK